MIGALGWAPGAQADSTNAPLTTVQPAAAAPDATTDAAAAAPLTTARMVHDFVAADDTDAPPGPDQKPDRKMHGFVEGWVGTGGVRGFAAGAVMPIGDHATLALSFSKGRAPGYYGYGYGYGRGYGAYNSFDAAFAFNGGGAGSAVHSCRSRYTPSYLQGPPGQPAPDCVDCCAAPPR